MKLALCFAAVSVLALAGCAVPDSGDLDEDSGEDVGEAADAICSSIIMPVVDTSATLSVANMYGGAITEYAVPSDSFYDPDNFTVEITFPGYGTQGAWMSDTDQASLTASNCSAVTVTSSFWVHNASTGCWSFDSTTSATGSWNGSSCDVNPPGISVPHTIDKVRMSGKSKLRTAFRGIGGTGWYVN